MELEFHQLVLKYQTLRVVTAGRQARLVASLMQHGQQSPVLVVQSPEGYVLVDGYQRVKALRHLGHDTVQTTVLDSPLIGPNPRLPVEYGLPPCV